MSTKLQDETILLREAIEQVLARAANPMTSVQISEAYEVNSLGLGTRRVTGALGELYKRKRKLFPLARVATASGHTQWEYYNPTVCPDPLAVAKAPPKPPIELTGLTEPPVRPPAMEFKGIPDVDPEPSINLPPEVQAVTISVGSITIRIDLTR